MHVSVFKTVHETAHNGTYHTDMYEISDSSVM